MNRKSSFSKKYNAFDLFAGAGGLSYGFLLTKRFNIIGANEILKDAGTSYKLNHPETKVIIKDICELTKEDIEKEIDSSIEDIDIVIGGPPCQAYSTAGKRLMSDPRALLFQEYIRMLRELNPKIFVFENVKGLLSMQKGELFKRIIKEFQFLGFNVYAKLLNSADFGVPQQRERVIVVGTKLKKEYLFPNPTHYNPEIGSNLFSSNLKPYLTLGEAISDLPSLSNNDKKNQYATPPQNDFQKLMRKNMQGELTEHSSPRNSEWLIEIMEMMPEGGSPKDLPEELRPKSGFGNSYCRLWWDKPSTTITRNLGTPSSARCIHPIDSRPLSTREGARLQSFPDSYLFYGSKSSKNLQIGEAVPPLFANAIAKSIIKHIIR
ncbi:MAG: DNA cytosine methyltransferase [Candidatus Dojkabacteria bacterium]|jgi:DNA (cytosine-5)-methyltransferase 1